MSEQPIRDTAEMMRRRNQLVTAQLLEELDAGRFDSALTKRIMAAPGSFPRLLRAAYLAAAACLDEARSDIDEALQHGRDNPVVELAAGMLLFVTRDHERALATLERAAKLSPKAAARAEQLRGEAQAKLATPDTAHDDDAAWIEQAKRLLLRALATYNGPKTP